MTRPWRWLFPALLPTSLLVGLASTPAGATVWFVTDPGDTLPGGAAGQLRKAIGDAANGDVIVIQVSQPINLSGLAGGLEDDSNAGGDLDIVGKSITIQGAGPEVTIVDGGGSSRVFHVLAGATLALSGVTVRGGADTGGAGIFNAGTLALVNVEVIDNHAVVTVGGVAHFFGTLTMSGVTIAGNTGGSGGGGVSGGGGIVVFGGTASLVDTTVSGNSSRAHGGGLTVDGLGIVTLTNVTITDNTADSDNGFAFSMGGGLRNNSGSIALRDTIIAGNRVGTGPGSGSPDCAGTLTSQGYNLVENPAGCTLSGVATGNITGLSAELGPLAANGGPTRTHALLLGSPALDAGDGACAPTDQRGVLRPQNGRCDIGAFELAPPSPAAFDFDGDGRQDVVVGAGRGVEPRVRVLSGATGGELLSFLAYDTPARASGGVRVAACDLTGDGVPDIVTAPGGGPVLIRAFNGTTGAPLPGAFGGFTVTPLGGRGPGATVACADVSGDGVPDILVGLPAGSGAESQVLSFSGVDGSPLGQATAIPGVAGEVFLAP